MQIKHILLLLFLPILLIGSDPLQEQHLQHVSYGPADSWVTDTTFSLDPLSIHPSQANAQILLLETQNHLDKKATFFHRAVKILTQAGVDNYSQLQFLFNPSFQNLVMHNIQIFRDGQWSDRMSSSNFKILQQEDDLDSNIYRGDLCLVYFLDDVRVGDIINYSCTFIGEPPAFSSHFARMFSFQERASIEKVYRRIVGNPSQELLTKSFNIEIEPQITVTPEIKEWVWESYSTAPFHPENNTPSWYCPDARVQVSQYKNWYEVVQKEIPLYTLSEDLLLSCTPEAIHLAQQWKEATDDPVRQATLALRFVQDKIRYQGFEDGKGAAKPTDPWIVLQRRYGDCKDKAFLLHTLLKLLEIDSTPVLVHSNRGKMIQDCLPSPQLFNHVVLKISIFEKDYWVDTTYDLQGGSLSDNHFPSYHWGLCVSEDSNDLVQLPPAFLEKPVTIDTSIITKTPDLVEMTIRKTRYGCIADSFRSSVERRGLPKISDNNLLKLKKKYGTVTVNIPMTVSDDRESNIFISEESYHIPTKTRSGKRIFKVHSFVVDALDDDMTADRSTPYALTHPLWAQEHITIMNPFMDWTPSTDEFSVELPSFNYASSSNFAGNHAEIQHEIKHLDDHIQPEHIKDYWNVLEDIKDLSSHTVDISPPPG